MKRVRQRHTSTCGAVALATASHTPYKEILPRYAKLTQKRLKWAKKRGFVRKNKKYGGSVDRELRKLAAQYGITLGRKTYFRGSRLRDIREAALVMITWRDSRHKHWFVWDGTRVYNMFWSNYSDLNTDRRGRYYLNYYMRIESNA